MLKKKQNQKTQQISKSSDQLSIGVSKYFKKIQIKPSFTWMFRYM